MPLDWIDAHRGAVPQINREDAGASKEMKAVAEERTRGLRVPGLTPGKLPHEEGAQRGMPASDPRGLVFDKDAVAPRPVSDDDYKRPARSAAPERTADRK